MPINWSNRIIPEAQWINDGPSAVNLGPTSDDEMMVLIAFYTESPITIATGEPKGNMVDRTLMVSPNPAAGKFYVTIPGGGAVRQLRLFNVSGQEVLRRQNLTGDFFEIETADLAPGIYFLDADGRKGKVVVER